MVRRNLIYGANLFIMENNGKLFSLQTGKTAYFFEKFQIGCLQLEYYNFSKPIIFSGKVSKAKSSSSINVVVLPSPLKSCLFVIFGHPRALRTATY